MSQTWKIRVRESEQQPFKYRATFVWEESGDGAAPLGSADLYAEGDLAAYLEDCGANLKDIADLLDSLRMASAAEIAVVMPDQRLEVLWSQPK